MRYKEPVNPDKTTSSTVFTIALLAAVSGIFIFTGFRAAVLSISHDEVLTALIWAKAPLSDILDHSLPIASNNHLLNTLLIKLFASFFGDGEFVLRTPALIGHVIYLAAVFRLCGSFLRKWMKLVGVVLLTTSPFLLDFFSCARGYSLGVGFSMLALSLLLPQVTSAVRMSSRRLMVFLLLLDVAVLSNVVFANILIALVLVLMISDVSLSVTSGGRLLSAASSCLRRYMPPLAAGAVPLVVIYRPEVLARIRLGMEDYGGKSGFWADTVKTLVESSLYEKSYPLITPVSMMVMIALLLVAGFVLILCSTRQTDVVPAKNALMYVLMTLFLIGLLLVVQFHIFGVPFAVERSALFLIPLFLFYLLLLSESALSLSDSGVKKALRAGVGLVMGLLGIHQVSCLNLDHYLLWKYDASAKDAMRQLVEMNRSVPRRMRTIGVTWQLEPAMNYYRFRFGAGWLPLIDRSGPDGIYDIYYLAPQDKYVVSKYRPNILKSYPVSGCTLAASQLSFQ